MSRRPHVKGARFDVARSGSTPGATMTGDVPSPVDTVEQPDVSGVLPAAYRTLLAHYGEQHWWPTVSGSRWEIMLGAVLTQRTTWRNAARSLTNLLTGLGTNALSDPSILLATPDERLIELLRPSGHFARKPRTLKLLGRFVLEQGGAEALAASLETTETLRAKLLRVWGIGPETADAILLYALDRPVFVADAYALRLATRWGLLDPVASYDTIQALFTCNLPADRALFNQYHALIVAHGRELCRPRPLCAACPLNAPIAVEIAVEGSSGKHTWRCPQRFVSTERKDR